MLYEMCQISKIIQHSYNLQRYGQMWQNFLLFYILFLSPLPSFFLFSSLSLFGFFSSPSNPNPLLSNLSLSLCLPLPISLSAVALLDLGASVLTKTLTFAAVGDSIPWLIALTFFFARGSSHSLSSSRSLSTRSGGPIGPRRRSCLGWCR